MWLTHVAARPGGDLLAVASSEGWLGIWLPIDNRIIATHALGSTINKVGWTFDGSYLLATVDDSVVVLSGDGKDRVTTIATGHDGVTTFAVHPSQQVVLTTGTDGVVRRWDVATATKHADLMEKGAQGSGGATAVALSDTTVVVGYRSGWFGMCDPDGQNPGMAELFSGAVASLAAIPNTTSFLAGGMRGKVAHIAIDPTKWRCVETWSDPPKPIAANTIEIAGDGKRFVVACSDNTARLYQSTADRFGDTLGRAFYLDKQEWKQDFIVSAACFVPGTKLIATSHFAGHVTLWHGEQTHRSALVRFEGDQPVWTRDGKPLDPIAKWPELEYE